LLPATSVAQEDVSRDAKAALDADMEAEREERRT